MNKNKGSIYFSLFVLISAVLRLVFSSLGETRKQEEARFMSGIQNAVVNEKRATMDSIVALVKAQGRIFLYTNDSLAEATWVPNIVSSEESSMYDMVGVRPILSSNDDYKYFLHNHDSLGFLLYAGHSNEDKHSLTASYGYGNGYSKTCLYFMGLYSQSQLAANKTLSDDYKEEVSYDPATTWNITFNDTTAITAKTIRNPSLLACMKLTKRLRAFHLYMAGVEKDNHGSSIDSAVFDKSVRELNTVLHKAGIDTTHFYRKVFPE